MQIQMTANEEAFHQVCNEAQEYVENLLKTEIFQATKIAAAFMAGAIRAWRLAVDIALKGRNTESAALERLALENFFHGLAVLKGLPVEDLIKMVESEIKKQAGKLNNDKTRGVLTPESKQRLDYILAEYSEKIYAKAIYDSADFSGFSDHYDGLYRTLSLQGAHASLRTINPFIKANDFFSPQQEDPSSTIQNGHAYIKLMLLIFRKAHPVNATQTGDK